MRKKYQNPALLTINFAFDSRLLDLVATSYEDQIITEPNTKSKRSFSEKNISKQSYKRTNAEGKLLKNQSVSKYSNKRKDINQGPNVGKIIVQNFNKGGSFNATGRLGNFSYQKNEQKIGNLKNNTPIMSNIEQQMTKGMIKNIRKNILGSNISPAQQNLLQKTYKQLLNRMKKT